MNNRIMRIRAFLLAVLSLLATCAAKAIEYPDYYCDDEAWSYSIPWLEGPHTYGQHKVGDFYYYILDDEKQEAAIVAEHKVFETCVSCQVACLMPSVKDWPKGTFEGDIEIPSEVEIEGKTYNVVMIGYGAFYGCENLNSVKIPESVRCVSSYVFYGCTNIEEVDFPDGCYLAPDVFRECPSLKSFDISKNKIAGIRLIQCNKLETVKLPSLEYSLQFHSLNCINCSNVKHIWLSDKEAPYMNLDVPDKNTVTLHVPAGGLQSYRETDWWKDFKNIVEYDLGDAAGVQTATDLTDDMPSEYYDLQGRPIAEPESGVYIRRTSEKTQKVLIRK